MLNALRLFILLPAWGYILLAGLLGWWVWSADSESRAREQAIVTALNTPAPEVVNLSDFDLARDVHLNREVAVEGWFGAGDSYPLNRQGDATTQTAEQFMYVLFGRDDPADARFVRAAVIMTAEEQEYFLRNMERFMGGVSGGGIAFRFSGEMRQNPALKDRAFEVLDQQRLWRDENFMFIRPWLNGREAGLLAKRQPVEVNTTGWLIVGLILLTGCLRLAWPRLVALPWIARFLPVARQDEISPAVMPEALPEAESVPTAKAESALKRFLLSIPGRFARNAKGMGMPERHTDEETTMTAKAVTRETETTHVLNDGQEMTGFMRFLMLRLAELRSRFSGKSAGAPQTRGTITPRSGRPVDPFDRLRQDRMG